MSRAWRKLCVLGFRFKQELLGCPFSGRLLCNWNIFCWLFLFQLDADLDKKLLCDLPKPTCSPQPYPVETTMRSPPKYRCVGP